jgi:hypothetical protein
VKAKTVRNKPGVCVHAWWPWTLCAFDAVSSLTRPLRVQLHACMGEMSGHCSVLGGVWLLLLKFSSGHIKRLTFK